MLKLWATLLLLIILIDAWGVTEKVACKSSKKKYWKWTGGASGLMQIGLNAVLV